MPVDPVSVQGKPLMPLGQPQYPGRQTSLFKCREQGSRDPLPSGPSHPQLAAACQPRRLRGVPTSPPCSCGAPPDWFRGFCSCCRGASTAAMCWQAQRPPLPCGSSLKAEWWLRWGPWPSSSPGLGGGRQPALSGWRGEGGPWGCRHTPRAFWARRTGGLSLAGGRGTWPATCTRGSLGRWTRALSWHRPGACGSRQGIPTAVACPAVCPAPAAPRPASDSGSEAQPEVFLSARVTPAPAAVGPRAARITREAGSSEARGRPSRLLGTPLGQRDREMLPLKPWRAGRWGQPGSPSGGPRGRSPPGGLLGPPARSSRTRRRDRGGTSSWCRSPSSPVVKIISVPAESSGGPDVTLWCAGPHPASHPPHWPRRWIH